MRATEVPSTNPIVRFVKDWDWFFFAPQDPTTLGLIRILTGVFVFYITLAYSPDLMGMFGKNSWFDWQSSEMFRKDSPTILQPNEWTMVPGGGYYSPVQLPDLLESRVDAMAWLRKLPADPSERKHKLRYLTDRLPAHAAAEALMARAGLEFVLNLSPNPTERQAQLDILLKIDTLSPEEREKRFPKFFQSFNLETRKQVIAEVKDFETLLPTAKEGESVADTPRGHIIHWMMTFIGDYGPRKNNDDRTTGRAMMVNFLQTLPKDDAQRNEIFDYIETWGVDPSTLYVRGNYSCSIWYHVTEPWMMWVVHVGILVVLALFTLGYCTRVTSVLAWIGAVSYVQRGQNCYVYGMDTMLNILMIYLMIGPSGAALSLDRWLAKRKAKRLGLPFSDTPEPSAAAGFVIRLIQIHFCFIYMASGMSKLKGATWWDGTAIWYTIANPEFTPMVYNWYLEGLKALASNRLFWQVNMAAGVVFTFFLELGFPFLVWNERWRPLMITLGMLLHTGIAIIMGLVVFSLLMMTLLLSFVPPQAVRRAIERFWPRAPHNEVPVLQAAARETVTAR